MYVAVRHVGHRAVLGRGWAGGGWDIREGETGAREKTTAEAKKNEFVDGPFKHLGKHLLNWMLGVLPNHLQRL